VLVNFMEIMFLAVLMAFGSWALYVSANRTRTTRLMQQRLIKVAAGMWECATEANQQNDETLLKLHNLIIEVAAISPAISARVVTVREDPSITAEERDRVSDFINRNAWVLNYMTAVSMVIDRLEFHAEPWRISRMASAFRASLVMYMCSEPDGGLRFSTLPSDAEKDAEKLGCLDTKDARDSWDKHAIAH
jgi:hypothetical protein